MRTMIKAIDLELTEGQRAMIEKKLDSAMKRVADRLIAVDLFISDINGPRGGRDKNCRVELQIRSAKPIVVSETMDTIEEAVAKSLDAAARSLNRNLEKRRDIRRNDHRKAQNQEFEPLAQPALSVSAANS